LVCGSHNSSWRTAVWTPPIYMTLEKDVVLLISWECGYTPVSYVWCRRFSLQHPGSKPLRQRGKPSKLADTVTFLNCIQAMPGSNFDCRTKYPDRVFFELFLSLFGTLHCTWPLPICFTPRPFSYSLSYGLSTLHGLCSVDYK
jgi:hypothetical protein